MVKIIAPNEQYTGLSASVSFVKGVGETEDSHLIEWFKSKGYQVEENQTDDNNSGNEPPNAELEFDKITKDQIKEKLDELEIEYTSNENKEALFEKLIAATEE